MRGLAFLILTSSLAWGHFPKFDPDDNKQGLPLMKWDFGKDNWKSFGDTSWNEHAKTYTLVDEAPEHNGRVWSRRKFKRTSWVMEWALKVKGEGTGVTDNLVGSGIALWITTGREKPGGLYGSTDKFNGVGIFFDSFDNDDKKDNPIIMGAENNGSMQFHPETDHREDRFGGCRAKYRNRGTLVRVKIKYTTDEEGLGHMQMWLSMKDDHHFDVCFAKDGIKLNCGTSKSGCRIGFSASNMPKSDAKHGDMVSISDFKLWDLSEQEQVATRRALAERDLAKKRNELHPELQEFLGNYDSNTKSEIDKLIQSVVEEVSRDRMSKHNEFQDLHKRLNETLALKGPITRNDVKNLLASVKEVQNLARTASQRLQELRAGTPGMAALTQSWGSTLMSLDRKKSITREIEDLHVTARRGHANSARSLQEAAASAETYGWIFYVVCVQVVVVVGLLAYKQSPKQQVKTHCV